MENASRMRIICNPFKKEIEYQWYDLNLGTYVEFDPENSQLAREELINATIQSRAYEIVDIINRECNVGNVGLEIIFVGTEDDYSDFCGVISNYYRDANISCIRDEHYYHTANFVMPKIKEKFLTIKTTLEGYAKDDDMAKLICKYNDAVKPSISLCVIGLYSAGKSAFINSIIGAEILPSASDPTTARVCKIYCDTKYQIRFLFDNKECILIFKGDTYKPSGNFEMEIIKELQGIVDLEEHRDEVFYMNRALEILNGYSNEKHQISDIIEIRMPFKQTALPVDEFDFVVYDTPGSNSDSNVRHFEVLQNSLDEQTNALPIFLTTPDTMDAEDNDKILRLIEEEGSSLDTTNAIVIVNKADEKGAAELKKKHDKCQDLKITKWKSTRIFFLSSLMAIASKKGDPDDSSEWIDQNMSEIYDEKQANYVSDKKKLFEFNIVDKSKADEISGYADSEKATHLYKNSGLESIEREVAEYAHRYALYNKCQQASAYLQQAIDLCVGKVQKNESKLGEKLYEVRGHFDSKKSELCNQLDAKKEELPVYNAEFQTRIGSFFREFTIIHHLLDDKDEKQILQKELKGEWKRLKDSEKKEKKDKSWALSQIQQYVNERYNDLLGLFSENANSHIVSFWNAKSNLFKEECKKIVHDSSALNDEQKHILESIVLSRDNMPTYRMEFNLRNVGAIKKKRFLIWKLKGEKFDERACCERLIKKFNDTVRERINSMELANEKNFKRWTESLINTLTEELCKFNSMLSSFEQQIRSINRDIEEKKGCKWMLDGSKEYIDELLGIQGRER